MFQKIKTISDAVESEESLREELRKSRRNRTGYTLSLVILGCGFFITISQVGGADTTTMFTLMVLFVSLMACSISNNSRCELLEAVAFLKSNSTSDVTKQSEQDAAGNPLPAE